MKQGNAKAPSMSVQPEIGKRQKWNCCNLSTNVGGCHEFRTSIYCRSYSRSVHLGKKPVHARCLNTDDDGECLARGNLRQLFIL